MGQTEFKSYRMETIPGDASKRLYFRVLTPGKSYILMDAREDNQSHIPFVRVAKYLERNGFCVPKIIAQDLDEGLLLLEDLGKTSFNQLLNKNPHLTEGCYDLAVDLCAKLATLDPEANMPQYSKLNFFNELSIFCDWFLSRQMTDKVLQSARRELMEIFEELYQKLSPLKPVPVLKDFMADNILWQNELSGIYKLGLIDFQDMTLGFPFYDLASILEDARRDVDEATQERGLKRYINSTPSEYLGGEPSMAYHIIAAQKNIRIIGVFYRLCYRDKKERYMMFIPRVMRNLKRNLESGHLKDLSRWFVNYSIYPSEYED